MEKPAGTKDMGSWTAAVYTPEQQARLGVDESGKPKAAAPLGSPVGVPKVGAIGPAWTRGEIEKPAGTKDMGGWTAGVYTAEQQARLGVDESGKPKAAAAVAKALPPPVSSPQPLTAEYVAALMNSEQLFADLCTINFRKYDTNKDGRLQMKEATKLCQDLHLSMGMFLDDEDIKAAIELTKDFAGGDKDSLSEEEFARWFRELLKESVTGRIQKVAQTVPALLSVTVKSMAGTERVVEVPRDSDVSTLAEAAAAAMDLPYAQTRISVNGQVVPDRTLLSSLELDVSSDPEVIAVVMNKLKVRRHVYKARGGAPPHRGYHLVATDEIDLAPNAKISEQMEILVPPDGISRRMPDHYTMQAFQASPNEQAPRKWEGGMNEVDLDASLTAEEIFGTLQNVDLAVMVPMAGFD